MCLKILSCFPAVLRVHSENQLPEFSGKARALIYGKQAKDQNALPVTVKMADDVDDNDFVTKTSTFVDRHLRIIRVSPLFKKIFILLNRFC